MRATVVEGSNPPYSDTSRWRDARARLDGMVPERAEVADRDPFTGIPHHRHVRCRAERTA